MRILIFGNSGSGKTTLAGKLAQQHQLAHLDLDVLAWEPYEAGQRRPMSASAEDIQAFLHDHDRWVIEGCYASLIRVALEEASELVFLNPGIEACIANCHARRFEPHKYATKEAQDQNLDMLIRWVRDYETRTDEFSLASHRKLFDGFVGKKTESTQNG